MPDRYVYHLMTAVASNTGGPYTATWDRVLVARDAVIRTVVAQARSVTSNSIQSRVDVYRQPNAPAAGSNTGATVLAAPVVLPLDGTFATGVVKEANAYVYAGDTLQLRTYSDTPGAKPSFLDLKATVEVEVIG